MLSPFMTIVGAHLVELAWESISWILKPLNRRRIQTTIQSKKSPTGPSEWTHKPEYLMNLIALAPYLGVWSPANVAFNDASQNSNQSPVSCWPRHDVTPWPPSTPPFGRPGTSCVCCKDREKSRGSGAWIAKMWSIWSENKNVLRA